MDKLAVCRICLAKDNPMRLIVNKCLQEMYKVLTKLPFVTDDSRPMLVCYICYASLLNSYKLAKSCLRSEELFQLMLSTDASLSVPGEQFPSSRSFVITRAVHIDYSPTIERNAETRLHELHNVDGEVKQEMIEDFRNETSEEMDIKSEEYSLNYDTNTMYCEELTLHSEIKTINERETDGTKCVKSESCDEHEYFDDTTRWSDTEQESLTAHNPTQVKPLNSTTNTLQTCDHFIDEGMKTPATQSENIDDKTRKHKKSDQSDDAEVTTYSECKQEPARNDVSILNFEIKPSNSASTHSVAFKTKKAFKRKDSLVKHKRKGSKKFYQCNICKKNLDRKTNLVNHMRIHTGEKPFECDVCNKRFNEKCGLIVHSRTHNGDKPFECDVCKKCFKQKVHLLGHYRTHTGEKPFECDVCNKFFSHKNALVKHRQIHTRAKIRHQCNVCKKSYQNKNRLQNHARIHTDEKSFECDLCKKRFDQKKYLRNHIRLHAGIKPYECDLCKRSFNQKHNLLRHSLTHTDKKPFECEVCKNCFSSKASLNRHQQGDKKFKCNLCDNLFCNSFDLISHASAHNGFECVVCKKRYVSKQGLDAHARSHTKAFQCDVCKKCFSCNYKLAKHYRTHTSKKL